MGGKKKKKEKPGYYIQVDLSSARYSPFIWKHGSTREITKSRYLWVKIFEIEGHLLQNLIQVHLSEFIYRQLNQYLSEVTKLLK